MFIEDQLDVLAAKGLLADDLRDMRAAIKKFVKNEVLPAELETPRDARGLSRDQVRQLRAKAKQAGYWMLEAPAEFGGAGLSAFEAVVLNEELAKTKFAFATRATGAEPPAPLYAGTPDQIDQFVRPAIENGWHVFVAISEPTGGSDPARAIRTTARRDGDSYILRGRKMWTTFADEAPYGVVYARTGEGRNGISAFVVDTDTPGLSVTPVPVMRNHWSTEVLLDDVRVPASRLLGAEGDGFKLAGDWTQRARLYVAAFCLGVAEESIRMAVEWSQDRQTFGAPLATRQGVQFSIADAMVKLRAARWLTWEAAWTFDAGRPATAATSAAKLAATEVGFEVVDAMLQIFGGMGVAKEFPLEHWFRDVRVCRIVEGPSDVHRYVIARDALGALSTATPAWESIAHRRP